MGDAAEESLPLPAALASPTLPAKLRRPSDVQRVRAVFAAVGLYDGFDADSSPPSPTAADGANGPPRSEKGSRGSLLFHPSPPASDGPLSPAAELLHQQERDGSHAFNEGRYNDALALFSAALPVAVDVGPVPYSFLLSKRSMTYTALELHDKAVEDAEKATLLHSSSSLAHYQRGLALQGQGRFQQAREALCTALTCLPSAEEAKDDGETEEEDEGRLIQQTLSELDDLLAEMQRAASQLSASSPRHSSHRTSLDAFSRWMEQGGASFPFLRIHTATASKGRSRSVHVLTSLPPLTPILSIPLSRLITRTQAMASPVGRALSSRGFPSSCSHSFLACYLHYHLHCVDSSPLLPYLRLLPPLSAFFSLPIFYPASILRLWDGTGIPDASAAMMRQLRGEYDLVVATLSTSTSLLSAVTALFRSAAPPSASTPPPSSSVAFSSTSFVASLSFDLFLRYHCYILSRAFALPLQSPTETELCLVPYADLLNHWQPASKSQKPRATAALVKWSWEAAQQRLVMRTVDEVRTGEEVQHCYGAKSNLRWLLHYGIVFPFNPHNTVDLTVSLPPSLPSSIAKRKLLSHLLPSLSPASSSSCFVVSLSCSPASPSSLEALSALRVVHATPAELGVLKEGAAGAVSEANETALLAYIAHSARVALGALPEQSDEGAKDVDEKARKGEGKTRGKGGSEAKLRASRTRMARLYRQGERRVWQWWAHTAELVKRRARRWREEEKRVDDDIHEGAEADEAADHYWTSVWVPMLRTSEQRLL